MKIIFDLSWNSNSSKTSVKRIKNAKKLIRSIVNYVVTFCFVSVAIEWKHENDALLMNTHTLDFYTLFFT